MNKRLVLSYLTYVVSAMSMVLLDVQPSLAAETFQGSAPLSEMGNSEAILFEATGFSNYTPPATGPGSGAPQEGQASGTR